MTGQRFKSGQGIGSGSADAQPITHRRADLCRQVRRLTAVGVVMLLTTCVGMSVSLAQPTSTSAEASSRRVQDEGSANQSEAQDQQTNQDRRAARQQLMSIAGDLTLEVRPEWVGIAGLTRPGDWVGMKLRLGSRSSTVRQLRCQWLVTDVDGDRVAAQRDVAIEPNQSKDLWLYAPINVNARSPVWQVSLIDPQTQRVILTRRVTSSEQVDATHRVVPILGSGFVRLGLAPYRSQHQQFEAYRFAGQMPVNLLPDRWYGLDMVQELIWTPGVGDPGQSNISPQVLLALRHWVQRGGHLVISLAQVGDSWYRSSLRSLLPPVEPVPVTVDFPPPWLGTPRATESAQINLQVLQPRGDVSVLLRDQQDRPIVVSHQVGLGRVTVMGVDMTSPRMVQLRLPNGPQLWNAVFGWRSPAWPQTRIEAELKKEPPGIVLPEYRDPAELAGFLSGSVSMTQTASTFLLLAILGFAVYWILAGASFFVLKSRANERHSWVAFSAIVLVFSLALWSAAWLARPGLIQARHFSVLDLDGHSGLRRCQSWVGVRIPSHREVTFSIGPDAATAEADASGAGAILSAEQYPYGPQTISTAGTLPGAEVGQFLDTRRYALRAGDPSMMTVPVRATSKTVRTHVVRAPSRTGRVGDPQTDAVTRWPEPISNLKLVSGWPRGELRHNLPVTLENVLLIYCPGNRQEPWVWRHDSGAPWPAGQALVLSQPQGQRLAQPPVQASATRWSGHLGDLLWGQQPGRTAASPAQLTAVRNQVVSEFEALSFFSVLPPPDYTNSDMMLNRERNYQRSAARGLDISAQLAHQQLIVIGHASDKAPLPETVYVDGQPVQAEGWTTVRWFVPIENP